MKNNLLPEHIIHIPRRFAFSEWGGAETYVIEICIRQSQLGMQPEIMTTTALSPVRRETFKNIPIRRYPYFYPYIGLSREAKKQLDRKAGNLFSFSLMRAIPAAKPDLIHLHTGKRLGATARRYAVRHRIPYVISLHGGQLAVPQSEQESWTEPTAGALEWGKILGWWVGSRRVLDDAAAIICVGYDEYEKMRSTYPDKLVRYLPNGVDVDRFSPGSRQESGRERDRFRSEYGIPDNRFVCLTAARFDIQKNQLGLVRQLRRIAQAVPEIHLLLIGAVTSAAYLEKIKVLAQQDGVADRVTIVPGIAYHDRKLIDAYRSADCFVLPSLHEPFGMVVLEAWAAELPTAASNRGGLPSIINEGDTGLLFDPEAPFEDPRSMGAAIVRLASDEQLRSRFVQAGASTARERYSWEAVNRELTEVYRRVYAHPVS